MPFKDSISKFAKQAAEGAKTAAKKSGDMVEITKINMQISSTEDKIKDIYSEIGKVVFIKFELGKEVDPDTLDLCNQAAEIKSNIEVLRQKIQELKNIKVCPGCGYEINDSTVFCPKCGAKCNVVEETVVKPQQQAVTYRTCPNCGTTTSDTSGEFCPNCGTKLPPL